MADLPQTTSDSTDPPRRKKASHRSRLGCLTCRTKRVKCDETLPTCKRCDRLKLVCEQPCSRILPSLVALRGQTGPRTPRDSADTPAKTILPKPARSPMTESSVTDSVSVADDMTGFYDDLDGDWLETYSNPGLAYPSPAGIDHPFDTAGTVDLNIGWLLPYPQEFSNLQRPDMGHVQLKSISTPATLASQHITLEGVALTQSEEKALAYFRTHFSLSQTTRDPQWSTTALLLEHSWKCSPMLLHLILAVSMYDLQSHGDMFSRTDQTPQRHYERGAQSLAQALQSADFSDHIGVLGSLFCVYAYMSRQTFVSSSKVDRLSATALDYIRKKGLDVLYTIPNPASSATQPPSVAAMKSDQSFIARLIMWLVKIDSHCAFVGCKSSLLEYFQSRRGLLDGIQATSRLALQLNWGKNYPISQSIRDIESAMSMDMLADLLIIMYKINVFGQNITQTTIEPQFVELKREIDSIEVKYGAVFYYGSSEMTLQPAMKLNCATSATMFQATKLYFLRCYSGPFGAQGSPEAAHTLGQLLSYAKHVCASGSPQPVYEYQWSLFIACLETNDMIHQEWLESKICDLRFREAVDRMLVLKRASGGEIDLNSVRRILQGPA